MLAIAPAGCSGLSRARARHIDEDLGVPLLLHRVRLVERRVDIGRGAKLQRHLDKPVDLDVVALGLQAVWRLRGEPRGEFSPVHLADAAARQLIDEMNLARRGRR
jgi:hypothetical protein